MIDHKLAKELKEAGFPQNLGVSRDSSWVGIDNTYNHYSLGEDYCYIPTLSELIEACGEGFESLIRTKTKDDYTWSARGYNYPTDGYKAPEEAVAKLWLALNKKVEIVKGDDERLLKGIENMVPKKRIEGFETYLT